ncbi:MAG: hypothetical protein RLZZ597_2803 [Cyanobacteriota bacterium]|jgi:hypothetical protein
MQISISPNFFCDGGGYLLTSASLGGSNLTPSQIADIVLNGTAQDIAPLLFQGICMPLLFEGDCALDRGTLFVVGDLTPQQEAEWQAKLTWKLEIPCGKLILLCSCMAEDLAHAISGEPPEEHYEIFQVVDVPPGSYLVEVYAYPPSLTVLMTLSDQEYEDYTRGMPEQDYDDDSNLTLVRYIVQLSPLQNFKGELVLPQTTDAWLDTFTLR